MKNAFNKIDNLWESTEMGLLTKDSFYTQLNALRTDFQETFQDSNNELYIALCSELIDLIEIGKEIYFNL